MHCDRGGPAATLPSLSPEQIRRWVDTLRPVAVQISGGEPLLRDDVVDCVRAATRPRGVPYVIVVTNASLLTPELYDELCQSGMDQLSISLDFPDERHDDFRRRAGLFAHLDRLLPLLAARGRDNVVLNTCITRRNMASLEAVYDVATRWGVNVSFSAYSARRTGDATLSPAGAADLAVLRGQLDAVLERKRAPGGDYIVTPASVIDDTYRFFELGRAPACQAGKHFLVITSDGELQPCSMQSARFADQRAMLREFTKSNDCDQCYVAIRSFSNRRFSRLVRENARDLFLRNRRPETPLNKKGGP